ncbi:MAG: MBL fold metallo-hydrolase [Ruminiclostridium sp.]|nr:MBL fold metallo-hydrolase [Ruminiclostridium sp.]
MILERLATGMFASNCYIIGANGEGVVIDPGADAGEISGAVDKLKLKIKYIILTHAHIDHIVSVDELRSILGAKVMLHENEARALANPFYNSSVLFGLKKVFKEADGVLKDGDILEAGGLKFEIIHTPGHTPGGICIKVGDYVFTGDTLFMMSVGRSDFGGGDQDQLMDSIKNKLMILKDDTKVFPGHGTSTTIGHERANNPFI